VLTALSSWLAGLLAGTFFIEYIFDWQGIGKLTIDALLKNDYPLMLGCCIGTGLIFVVIMLLVDLFYSLLDPRVRL
jgi:peptide/nickel transport system permease protein